MEVIQVRSLTKDYGNKKGIFDVDLCVKKGEVFGFLGPNGAGKTTTIRHLLGFMRPQKGTVSVLGLDAYEDSEEIGKRLGYLPGEIAFMDQMTGEQFIHFIGEMRGMQDFSYAETLLEEFKFDASGDIRKMSKGMKQKLGIICAFMHDPEVLILDEPTSGLDPLMQKRFVELVLKEKKKGKTILMSSHIFEEVEKTCDRIGMIKDGRILTVQDADTLTKSKENRYIIYFSSEEMAEQFAAAYADVISQNQKEVVVAVRDEMTDLIRALTEYKVLSLKQETLNLEEIFMQYYGGGMND
ncbi:methionine ABC transporter ATP-binding protein [Lachnospiraceae bacterium KM106-2]|nr:methionine ABC transporter ATP-binding protein [Lachnospiraceae bacterium KM106-2]